MHQAVHGADVNLLFMTKRKFPVWLLAKIPLAAAEARVDSFVAALRERAREEADRRGGPLVVACFGHSDFFHLLCERHLGIPDRWLDNAEVLRVELPAVGTSGEHEHAAWGDQLE